MKFYFPCANGISCFNDGGFYIAVISSDGNKKVANKDSKNKIILYNIAFLRGILYFFCGIFAIFSTFNYSYHLSNFEESAFEKSISKKLYVSARYFFVLTAVIFSFLLSFLLLGVAPAKLSFVLMGSSADLRLRAFVIATIKILIIYLILLLLRFIPQMQTFYRFNAACNKIASNKAKNIHKPLNFVNFLIFTLLFSVFMVSFIAVSINPWANFLIDVGIVILSISICYEILFLIEKFDKKLGFLCILTSWFVTVPPKVTQEEIAKVVKMESQLKRDESVKQSDDNIALSAVVAEMQTKLENSGRYEKSDVEWIVASVLDKNRAEAKLVRFINQKQYREIMSITQRRAKGEPLSNIFGFVDFYGLKIDVNKKVLTPRPETEILVEQTLKLIKDGKKKDVCDLCTGSGAIAVALAKNCDCKITAIDISKQAIQVAANNAKKHQVKIDFVESDLFARLKKFKKFDIIVSNPPYIASKEIDKLDDEVKKYDPRLALDGGPDGLDFYKRIVSESKKHLNKRGVLILEVGKGQAKEVQKLLKQNGYVDTRIIKDYSKIERIVYGTIGN